jgi:hypothetical protein
MRHVNNHVAGSALVAFGFAVAMMGTTLPTPLYPLYNRAFDLAPVLTPGVGFVALAVGMVTAGLLFCAIVGVCVLGVLYTLRRQSVRHSP